MTVSTTQNRIALQTSGLTKDFDFPFPYQLSTDIHTFLTTAAGASRELGANEFAVSNPGGGVGGRVSLTQFPIAGDRLSIVRIPPLFQETVLEENTEFYLKTVERAFDRQTMFSQRLQDLISRALVLPDADLAGSGAYQAGGNRITGLGAATAGTDAVTLAQVQAMVGSGGSGTGTTTWPTTPPPDSVVTAIINDPALQALFYPLNTELGNLSASILALNSANAGFSSSIGTINTTMTDMQADIAALSVISGDANNIITLINTETTQRIAGDVATATVISKIGAADGDNVSFQLNLATVKVSPTETLGTRFTGLSASIAGNAASVAAETTARLAGDNALAQTITKIGTLTDAGAAFLIDVNTAKVSPSETLAQRFAALTSSVNGASAAITNEQSARAAADTSLAASITTLQSNVSGYSVAIQQNATAVNGLSAKYSIKIDNNGKVTGYGLLSDANNGTPTSQFVVLADAFKVFNNTTDVAPFVVAGGIVQMQNVQISGSLLIDGTLTASKIQAGTITADRFVTNAGVDLASIVPGSLNTTVTAADAAAIYIASGVASGSGKCVTASVPANGRFVQFAQIAGDFRSIGDSFPPGGSAQAAFFLEYSTNGGGSWTAFSSIAITPVTTNTGFTTFQPLTLTFLGVLPPSGNVLFRLNCFNANGTDVSASGVGLQNLALTLFLAFSK